MKNGPTKCPSVFSDQLVYFIRPSIAMSPHRYSTLLKYPIQKM